jgi:hypothetical protein
MKFNTETVYLSGHWLSALINGDHTGLDAIESVELSAFEAQYPNAIFDPSDNSEFERDQISGLMAECYTVKIHSPAKED